MSGWMHADRSKNINSSAFDCGLISLSRQPVGNGLSGSESSPPVSPTVMLICRSVKTTRPHFSSSGMVVGEIIYLHAVVGNVVQFHPLLARREPGRHAIRAEKQLPIAIAYGQNRAHVPAMPKNGEPPFPKNCPGSLPPHPA